MFPSHDKKYTGFEHVVLYSLENMMENGGKEKTKQLTAEIGDMKLTMSYIS